MSDLIKPTMSTRLQRILGDTAKIDRMKYRELQKDGRERMLVQAKKTHLPLVTPKLNHLRDEKCDKCNSSKKSYTKYNDWFLEPIDALELKIEKDWIRISLLRRFLSSAMDSLVIHPAHIKMLKNLSSETPLVFVMKSENPQIDILLVIYTLWVSGIKLPLATVDKNFIEIPIVGRILTELGLKSFNEAEVAAHLHGNGNFLVQLDGNDEEEMKKVLEACAYGQSKELLLVPVSVNSEKILDKFSWKFFKNESLGIVKLNFHEPYSTEDFVKFSNADEIVQHFEFDLTIKRPVMSTNVVAFLLLTEFRNGVEIEDFAVKLDEFRGHHREIDFGFDGSSEDVINHAISILGEDLVKENFKLTSKVSKLSRYAEVVTPYLVMESILVITAQSLKASESFVDFDALVNVAVEVCELLSLPIKPCVEFSHQLLSAFDRLTNELVMTRPEKKAMSENEQRARRMAKHFESDSEDDDGYQSRNTDNEVTVHKDAEELRNVVVPILDAYLTVAYCLKDIIGGKSIELNDFISISMQAMREELEDGNCHYWESCCERWMRKFVKCLEQRKMIEINGSRMNIQADYDNKTSIKRLIKRIKGFF